jgi:hypothetical protein
MSEVDRAVDTDPPPSLDELLLNRALYDLVMFSGSKQAYLHTLRYGSFQFDAHCIRCDKLATFKATSTNYIGTLNDAIKPGFFNRAIACTRDEKHFYVYEFLLNGDGLQKIGQFPSIEDVIGSDLRRYKSVLPNEDFRELRRATGLFSHGIGIGSFVYLRRIFERMIYRHRDDVEAVGGKIDSFDKMRMDEKIGSLANVLPPALVKNKAVYSILSTGIHELDEDQCRRYFPVVRAAIIQILEQALEGRERQKAEQALEREIARIHGETR